MNLYLILQIAQWDFFSVLKRNQEQNQNSNKINYIYVYITCIYYIFLYITNYYHFNFTFLKLICWWIIEREIFIYLISSYEFFSCLKKVDKNLHSCKRKSYWGYLSHFRFKKACMMTQSKFFRNCEQIFCSTCSRYSNETLWCMPGLN